jgi:hypothetical protein
LSKKRAATVEFLRPDRFLGPGRTHLSAKQWVIEGGKPRMVGRATAGHIEGGKPRMVGGPPVLPFTVMSLRRPLRGAFLSKRGRRLSSTLREFNGGMIPNPKSLNHSVIGNRGETLGHIEGGKPRTVGGQEPPAAPRVWVLGFKFRVAGRGRAPAVKASRQRCPRRASSWTYRD